MRRLLVVPLLLLAACRATGTPTVTGASSPHAAVDAFIGAAKAQDLQAMSFVWGSQQGPAARTMDRAQLEQRELILIRLMCQDDHRVVGQALGVDGRQLVRTELRRGVRTVTATFTTIRGPGDRWYVEDIEVARLQELCVG